MSSGLDARIMKVSMKGFRSPETKSLEEMFSNLWTKEAARPDSHSEFACSLCGTLDQSFNFLCHSCLAENEKCNSTHLTGFW